MEEEEKKLGIAIRSGDSEAEDSVKKEKKESRAFGKIKNFLASASTNDRLDFTQNILMMAQELGPKLTLDGIYPAFRLLSLNNEAVKIALIE